MKMDLRLSGKNALVTGASQGLGRAIAKTLAMEGVRVFATARNAGLLDSLAEEIVSEGGIRPVTYLCDFMRSDAPEEIAQKALENSRMVLVASADEMMALSNAYAPEHLIIQTADYEQLAERVVNAGSVFLGQYACESAGDYASGTNHTLPTHGYATAYNGVNLDSYCRKITFQHLTEDGIRHIGRAVELMAEAEQLDAHKNAMTVRINSLKK